MFVKLGGGGGCIPDGEVAVLESGDGVHRVQGLVLRGVLRAANSNTSQGE